MQIGLVINRLVLLHQSSILLRDQLVVDVDGLLHLHEGVRTGFLGSRSRSMLDVVLGGLCGCLGYVVVWSRMIDGDLDTWLQGCMSHGRCRRR